MVSLTSYPWGLLGGHIRYCYGESLATVRCCGHCRVHLDVIFFIWIKSMWRWPHALRCMNVHHNWMMIAMYSVVARQTVGQLFWPSFFNVSNHMDSIHQIGGELRYITKKKNQIGGELSPTPWCLFTFLTLWISMSMSGPYIHWLHTCRFDLRFHLTYELQLWAHLQQAIWVGQRVDSMVSMIFPPS